jgi:hypothetical protein
MGNRQARQEGQEAKGKGEMAKRGPGLRGGCHSDRSEAEWRNLSATGDWDLVTRARRARQTVYGLLLTRCTLMAGETPARQPGRGESLAPETHRVCLHRQAEGAGGGVPPAPRDAKY